MRTALVLMLVALAGCATTRGESDVTGGTCTSLARQTQATMDAGRMRSIDPQAALSSFQLYCMKDTPLGL